MTIKRTDLNDDNNENNENENEDNGAAEREATEAARTAELAEARQARHDAEIAAATAKGEADALRRGNTQTPAPQWTDDQWEAEAQKHGTTGAALRAQVEIAKTVSGSMLAPLREETERAKKEAAEAREEISRLKSRKSLDSVESGFYDKNPALKSHRKEVDEFLASYPDADTVDSKTLEKRLSMAQNMVKGKVKENMRTNKGGDSTGRIEGGDEREENSDDFEFDPKGTGNEGAAHLMSRVHSNFGQNLKHEDSVEVWKKCRDEEGRGVSIGMDEDIAIARRLSSRNVIGGKRGEV